MLPIQIPNVGVANVVDLETVIELTSTIIARRCYNRFEDKRDEAIVTYIVSLQVDRRLYTLNSRRALDKLWDEIRSSKALTDFVLESTNELILRLSTTDAWLQVVNAVWRSLHASYSDDSCIDTDTLTEMYPDPEFTLPVLVANPWFVFLQLAALATLQPTV